MAKKRSKAQRSRARHAAAYMKQIRDESFTTTEARIVRTQYKHVAGVVEMTKEADHPIGVAFEVRAGSALLSVGGFGETALHFQVPNRTAFLRIFNLLEHALRVADERGVFDGVDEFGGLNL